MTDADMDLSKATSPTPEEEKTRRAFRPEARFGTRCEHLQGTHRVKHPQRKIQAGSIKKGGSRYEEKGIVLYCISVQGGSAYMDCPRTTEERKYQVPCITVRIITWSKSLLLDSANSLTISLTTCAVSSANISRRTGPTCPTPLLQPSITNTDPQSLAPPPLPVSLVMPLTQITSYTALPPLSTVHISPTRRKHSVTPRRVLIPALAHAQLDLPPLSPAKALRFRSHAVRAAGTAEVRRAHLDARRVADGTEGQGCVAGGEKGSWWRSGRGRQREELDRDVPVLSDEEQLPVYIL